MPVASSVVSPKRIIGVELEYEGVSAGKSDALLTKAGLQAQWNAHTDGSLRPADSNTEFVLAYPMPALIALEQVDKLLDAMQKSKLRYSTSWRCGLHVHVDHRIRGAWQTYNALIATAFLDPLIFDWEGHGRQESKFCVPIWDYHRNVNAGEFVSRYASLNMAALKKYGSLEFRHPQCSLDPEFIKAYINIVLSICLVAASPKFKENPSRLLDSLGSSTCLQQWVFEHFPLSAARFLCDIPNSYAGKYRPTAKEIGAGFYYLRLYEQNQ